MLQIFMFLSTSIVLGASIIADKVSQKFDVLKFDLSTIFLSIVSLLLLMVVFEKIKLMLGLDSLTLDAKKQIRKEETLAKLRAKKAELKQIQQAKKDEKQRKTKEKKAQQSYIKLQKFKSEVEKLRAREQAKEKFQTAKYARDTRQNEIIKEAAKAELNHKINTRPAGEFMSQKYRDEMNSNLYAKYDGNSKEYLQTNSIDTLDKNSYTYLAQTYSKWSNNNIDNASLNRNINERYMLNAPLTRNESGEVQMQNRDYKLGKMG